MLEQLHKPFELENDVRSNVYNFPKRMKCPKCESENMMIEYFGNYQDEFRQDGDKWVATIPTLLDSKRKKVTCINCYYTTG